jgi:uncharacterized protein (DUF58 family)
VLAATIGLGFAAMTSGNNLLYLLVSMLLGLIVVSGILSEQSVRRLRFAAVTPDDLFAGRPALVGVRLGNRKRWRASYSLTLEVKGVGAYVPRLPPGAEQLVTWETAFAARGRQAFPHVVVATRFPFGLFFKSGTVEIDAHVIVYPTVRPVDADARRQLAAGGASVRRRGRGVDLYNLRDYRAGDEPRMIHWRSSAKTGGLVVRELEADTSVDTRLVLDGAGRDAARLEAGLSEAASLAVHLLRQGGAVELSGRGVHVPLGRGREQRRRILTALALFDAADAARAPSVPRSARHLREIRVAVP